MKSRTAAKKMSAAAANVIASGVTSDAKKLIIGPDSYVLGPLP